MLLSEGSEGKEESVGKGREGDPWYAVPETLERSPPAVLGKAELVSDELSYRDKGSSKHCVEGATWFFFLFIVKGERKQISWGKNCETKEIGLEGIENSQPPPQQITKLR